jgi:predicted Zn-dependent protease with MMP-like domain
MRLDDEDFDAAVRDAIDSLPEDFRKHLDNVIIQVQPQPDKKMLRDLKLRRRDVLLGLYRGLPLTEKSVLANNSMPEIIYIFKDNIESICPTRRRIVQQVRKIILHEIGHHFGMDEDDLDRLGYA